MIIGGLQKLSLVDYPGKTSIAIFTVGCNMRCGFCHNAELVVPEKYALAIDEKEVFDLLEKRIGLVESVTISGGEPTLHPDLPEFIAKIKKLGYLVKLDSNGTRPDKIKNLLDQNLLDFIAMDVKAPLDRYELVVNHPIDTKAITESIKLIKQSGIDYEFRTTIVSSLHRLKDFDEIGKLISQGGKAQRYALQHFNPGKTLDPSYADDTTFSEADFKLLEKKMQTYANEVVVH